MNSSAIRNEIRREMNEKPRLKVLAFWVFLSALGIVIIKTLIRPKHLHLTESLTFLQGTLPNFFAGAMFCVLAFLYYGAFVKNSTSIMRRLTFAFLFSFTGLTLWEYIQYFMGYSIDYYDILMTACGNLFTCILILLLRIK